MDHVGELARVVTVRIDAGVGTERDFDPCLDGLGEVVAGLIATGQALIIRSEHELRLGLVLPLIAGGEGFQKGDLLR